MLKFYIGRFNKFEFVAAYSGVCKINAAVAAQILIDFFQVDAIVNAGTAGRMDESVRLFDTVVSDRMVYHDIADDILTEFHPWLKSNYFLADRTLFAAAQSYGQKTEYPVLFGTMVTGEQFIEDEKGNKSIKNMRPFPLIWRQSA